MNKIAWRLFVIIIFLNQLTKNFKLGQPGTPPQSIWFGSSQVTFPSYNFEEIESGLGCVQIIIYLLTIAMSLTYRITVSSGIPGGTSNKSCPVPSQSTLSSLFVSYVQRQTGSATLQAVCPMTSVASYMIATTRSSSRNEYMLHWCWLDINIELRVINYFLK